MNFYGLILDEQQKVFVGAILDPEKTIVFCNAKAGTGKTTLAMGAANLLVKDNRNELDGILYIVSPYGEQKQGYLPGSVTEKSEVYFEPAYQAMMECGLNPNTVVCNESMIAKKRGDAYIKLLEEKPLDDITINELCDAADVRRATFYKHYKDKFDFISAFTKSLREEFDRDDWSKMSHLEPKEYFAIYAKEAVTYIEENSVAVNNLIKSSLFPSALSVIIEQNYKDTRDRLNEYVKNGFKLQASVEVTASILSGGVASAIFCWLVEGKKISADELADQIYKFLISSLKAE